VSGPDGGDWFGPDKGLALPGGASRDRDRVDIDATGHGVDT